MLYKTKYGHLVSEDELNGYQPGEIADLGIHVVENDWQEWT